MPAFNIKNGCETCVKLNTLNEAKRFTNETIASVFNQGVHTFTWNDHVYPHEDFADLPRCQQTISSDESCSSQ